MQSRKQGEFSSCILLKHKIWPAIVQLYFFIILLICNQFASMHIRWMKDWVYRSFLNCPEFSPCSQGSKCLLPLDTSSEKENAFIDF